MLTASAFAGLQELDKNVTQGSAGLEIAGQQKCAFDRGSFHIPTSQHSSSIGITLAQPSASHPGVTVTALNAPVVLQCAGLTASTWNPGTIQVRDAIVAVDDIWVLGETLEHVEQKLQAGPSNSTVKLRLLRKVGQEEMQYTAVLKRQLNKPNCVLPSVQARQQKATPPSFYITEQQVATAASLDAATQGVKDRMVHVAGRAESPTLPSQQHKKHGLEQWSPLTAVKQWCPEVDPDGPKSTRRSIDVPTPFWSAEMGAFCENGPPVSHWIPEAKVDLSSGSRPDASPSHSKYSRSNDADLLPSIALRKDKIATPNRSPVNTSDLVVVQANRPFVGKEHQEQSSQQHSASSDAMEARGALQDDRLRNIALRKAQIATPNRSPVNASDLVIIHAARPDVGREHQEQGFQQHSASSDAMGAQGALKENRTRHSVRGPVYTLNQAADSEPGSLTSTCTSMQTASTVIKSLDSPDATWIESAATRQLELPSQLLAPGKHGQTLGPSVIQAAALTAAAPVPVRQARVLHSGFGGVGLRRESGCFGRGGKTQVMKSHTCSLRMEQPACTTLEFEYAKGADIQCFQLSGKTQLHVKGGRIELVQPDGRHMWLWNVPPHVLVLVHEAFSRMHEGSVAGDEALASTVSGSHVREYSTVQAHANEEKSCVVELGFAPLGVCTSSKQFSDVEHGTRAGPTMEDASHALGTDVSPGVSSKVRSSRIPGVSQRHVPKVEIPALRLHVLQPQPPYMPSSAHLELEQTNTPSTGGSGQESDSEIWRSTFDEQHTARRAQVGTADAAATLKDCQERSPAVNAAELVAGMTSEAGAATGDESPEQTAAAQGSRRLLSPISISVPAPSKLTRITSHHTSAFLQPQRSRNVIKIVQTAQANQPVSSLQGNESAGAEPPRLAVSALSQPNPAASEVPDDLMRPKAGRSYRSHLLRRIDPASDLNLARCEGAVSAENAIEVPQHIPGIPDGRVFQPAEMDEIIKRNQSEALQNAVVLM